MMELIKESLGVVSWLMMAFVLFVINFEDVNTNKVLAISLIAICIQLKANSIERK